MPLRRRLLPRGAALWALCGGFIGFAIAALVFAAPWRKTADTEKLISCLTSHGWRLSRNPAAASGALHEGQIESFGSGPHEELSFRAVTLPDSIVMSLAVAGDRRVPRVFSSRGDSNAAWRVEMRCDRVAGAPVGP
jgi:hypothetical protein